MLQNMDKIIAAVDFVWDNRERIADVIENLPETLRKTGDTIEGAGGSAIKASAMLTGRGDSDVNASELSQTAATALTRTYKQIQSAATIMDDLYDDLKMLPMLGSAAGRLQTGSASLNEISGDLSQVATMLGKLSGVLLDAGDDPNNVGQNLLSSGQTLKGISGDTKMVKPDAGTWGSGDAASSSSSRGRSSTA